MQFGLDSHAIWDTATNCIISHPVHYFPSQQYAKCPPNNIANVKQTHHHCDHTIDVLNVEKTTMR